jgi:hypothetical protein
VDGAAGCGLRLVQQGHDAGHGGFGIGAGIALHHAPGHGALVEILVRDPTGLLRCEAIGQQQQRRAFQRGAGQAVDRIADAGALGGQHHARRAGQLGIRHGGDGGVGLLAGQDEVDAVAGRGLDNVERGAAAGHAPDAPRASPCEFGKQGFRQRHHHVPSPDRLPLPLPGPLAKPG